MPILDITAEAIGPERTRLVLSQIENVMLWPHDERQREAAASTALANLLGGMPPTAVQAYLALEFGELVQWLTKTTPPDQLEEAAKQPFARGTVAGLILVEALHAKETGRNRNLQQIKGDIRKRLSQTAPFDRLAPSTLETYVWGRYSPVAHFWGAFILAGFDAVAARSDVVFPCRLADLPRFLAVSEALRVAGEQCKLRSDRTLLDASRTWRVPEGLPLPRISLRFP